MSSPLSSARVRTSQLKDLGALTCGVLSPFHVMALRGAMQKMVATLASPTNMS